MPLPAGTITSIIDTKVDKKAFFKFLYEYILTNLSPRLKTTQTVLLAGSFADSNSVEKVTFFGHEPALAFYNENFASEMKIMYHVY